MKLFVLNCTFLLALSSMASMADELPTCLWLHLDQDTRVYQCAVLPPEAPPEAPRRTELIAESLPDPTQPIAQQATVQNDTMANIIPDFLRESIARPEAGSLSRTAPDTGPKSDPMAAKSAVDSYSPVQKIAVVANGEIESVKALMQVSKDVHFYVLPTSGRLSLGVYSSTANAKRRQAAMLIMGIESELMTLGTEKPSNVTPQVKRQIEVDVASVLASSSKSGLEVPLRRNNAVSGYLVAAVGNQEDLIAELKRIRVSDFIALTADPYRDRVSLGVYSLYENALARQNYFKQLGIDSDLISRNEPTVVRSTLPTALPIEQEIEIEVEDVPYGYNQIALQPLEI